MKSHYQYVLTRWGQHYALWDFEPQRVKQKACDFFRRPWWWLRLLGWNVGFDPEGIPSP